MKILFDTNVILDVMLLREPFFKAATSLLAEVERKKIAGYICSTTVTTIHYLVSKVKGTREAKKQIAGLLQIFQVTHVDKTTLESALNSKFQDYEDSVLYESALREGLDGIVTRNRKDFLKSKFPIYDPKELLNIISSTQ